MYLFLFSQIKNEEVLHYLLAFLSFFFLSLAIQSQSFTSDIIIINATMADHVRGRYDLFNTSFLKLTLFIFTISKIQMLFLSI